MLLLLKVNEPCCERFALITKAFWVIILVNHWSYSLEGQTFQWICVLLAVPKFFQLVGDNSINSFQIVPTKPHLCVFVGQQESKCLNLALFHQRYEVVQQQFPFSLYFSFNFKSCKHLPLLCSQLLLHLSCSHTQHSWLKKWVLLWRCGKY